MQGGETALSLSGQHEALKEALAGVWGEQHLKSPLLTEAVPELAVGRIVGGADANDRSPFTEGPTRDDTSTRKGRIWM